MESGSGDGTNVSRWHYSDRVISRLATWLRTRPLLGRTALRAIPDVPWTIRVDPIGPFRIRLRRDRRFWLRHPLTHERWAFGTMRRLVRPGDTVFDIGANTGLYARFLVQEFGAGQVVCFEPMAGNLELLKANVALGGIEPRIRIVPVALADHEGREALQADDFGSATAALETITGGRASESHRQYGIPGRREMVEVAPLDALMRRLSLPAPTVMKIDVEGAEAMVLRGARETIMRHRPRLAIELHGPETAQAVLRLVHEMGYRVWAHGFENWEHVYRPAGPHDADGLGDSRWMAYHFVVASHEASDVERAIEPYTGPAGRADQSGGSAG